MRVPSMLAMLMAVSLAGASASDSEGGLNPIRKVVTMLQTMQKRVAAEGAREEELYGKFMCYCKTGGSDLAQSISSAQTKVPSVSSSIEASEEKLVQAKAHLKEGQTDRSSAKDAMVEATALRKKEASAFAKSKADYDANIAAIAKAVGALEQGMAGGFLQTGAADVLRQLAVSKQDMLDADRQDLLAFLSSSHGSGYAPASGEITGILKEMGDTMSKSLADITADEMSAIQTFRELMAAKTKEVGALTATVEAKTKQIGELGVEIVQMKEDMSDTEAALAQDQEFLANLDKSCATKTSEWEERSKTRADELVALAETIKVLNDDDALDLFKKTLPSASSASLMQVTENSAMIRAQAVELIRRAHDSANTPNRAGLDFLVVALSGKKALAKGGFDKVITMIDNMVTLLKQEQHDDDDKKEYCGLQLDQADDKKKAVERNLELTDNGIATATETMATLKDEIKALEVAIKELDKSVVDATEQRKEEHAEYKDLIASDSSAKELLQFAKNRLNKFYNPKLYNPPAKRELSEQDRIVVNMGGDAPPTEAPGGIAETGIGAALVQISAHKQTKDAPPPPPSTWEAYSTKSEQNTGVIAMIDLLIRDLDKELTEAETDEKNAQASYETMMRESAAKRSTDSKSLSEKVSASADTEAELQSLKENKGASGRELMATTKYIVSLHAECDWLIQYHDVRKEARAGEMDSLTRAKAILSGADFALVQTRAHGFLERVA